MSASVGAKRESPKPELGRLSKPSLHAVGIAEWLLFAFMGLCTWALVSWPGLQNEFFQAQPRWPVLGVLVVPLLALLGALLWRRPFAALLLLPSVLLPSFVVMQPEDLRELGSLRGASLLAFSLLAFCALGSRLSTRRALSEPTQTRISNVSSSVSARRLLVHFVPRLLLLLALIVIPLVALYSDAAQARLEQRFGAEHLELEMLVHTAHAFVLFIASYVGFFSAALNQSLDLYELGERLRQWKAASQRPRLRLWIVFMLATALSLVAFSAYLGLH